jgi:hypothetical protein
MQPGKAREKEFPEVVLELCGARKSKNQNRL